VQNQLPKKVQWINDYWKKDSANVKGALHDKGFETMADLCEFTKAEDIASSIKVTVPAIRGMSSSVGILQLLSTHRREGV